MILPYSIGLTAVPFPLLKNMRHSRFRLSELTLSRLRSALLRRIDDVSHSLAWKFSRIGRQNAQNLEKYKDIHKGERCFILGNGPSLAKMDISQLQGEITFGLNRIYLLFEKMPFRPSYYVCVNELVLEQYSNEISDLEMPKFLNWNRRHLFDGSNKDNNFLRLSLGLVDYFGTNPLKALSSGGTVTYVALQLAFFMGFSEVVLLGVDHRFAVSGTPNQTELRTSEKDENHFHPAYFPKGSKWQLPDLLRSEHAYSIADQFFSRKGSKVYDATLNGNCPVFEKREFLSFFARE
jgi:hypothetical protein